MDGLPGTIDYLQSRYRARVVIVGGRFAFTELSALLTQAETFEEANERFDAAKGKYGMKQEIARLTSIAERAGGGRSSTCARSPATRSAAAGTARSSSKAASSSTGTPTTGPKPAQGASAGSLRDSGQFDYLF